MRTFLDENHLYGSTFLMYGNVNDKFYGADMTVCTLQQYLVALLKRLGYKHVIFYGSSGTRGAYCLDRESAEKFFRKLNASAAVSDTPEQSAPTEQTQTAPDPSNPVGTMLNRHRKKRGYTPGSLSGSGEQPLPDNQTPPAQPTASRRMTFSLRGISMGEFYSSYRQDLLSSKEKVAMVLYDIMADQNIIFSDDSIKDDILTNFSASGNNGLLLLIAPETETNTAGLNEMLSRNGLAQKFLIPGCSGHPGEYQFNPTCTFRVGYPDQDEVKNMLHRFAVVGTPDHIHITFSYRQLNELADRILTNSSKAAQRDNKPERRRMCAIAEEVCSYVRRRADINRRIELTADDFDSIWQIHEDPDEALKALDKPGWEEACKNVKKELKKAEAFRKRQAVTTAETHVADISLTRFCNAAQTDSGPRPPIPNFVITGNPGVGKSEISRLIGQILVSHHILKVGHTVEVKKNDLTDIYVSSTLKNTMQYINKAEEGVLFIDEAESLAEKDGGANHVGTGVQIVQTLNGAMTDPNHHFCVVMAGYHEKMMEVFKLDPGFDRRFQSWIHLDDYQPELLYTILEGMVRDSNLQLGDDLTQEQQTAQGQHYVPLKVMLERIYAERDREKFGNAGTMKKLVEEISATCGDDGVIHQKDFIGAIRGTVTAEYFTPRNLDCTTEQILRDMDERFVGMEETKRFLDEMSVDIEREIADGHKPDEISLDPILLVGHAGTGKTVSAEALAKMLFHYGVLGTPELVRCNSSELAGRYAGEAQQRILEKVKDAQNKRAMLFVDEAHNLCSKNFDGQGALKAMMAPMTDAAHPFLACFAVYTENKDEFLNLDPGAKSRMEKYVLSLKDYNPEELFEIFRRAMVRKGYNADDSMLSLIQKLMKGIYETRTPSTGNARHVLNLLQKMITRLNMRCKKQGISFRDSESKWLKEEDIPEEERKNLNSNSGEVRLEQLNQLEKRINQSRVGNEELKKMLIEKVDALKIRLLRPELDLPVPEPGHFFFKGNTGTGKTTSANLVAEFFFEMGLIQNKIPQIIPASKLVGQYLGETGEKTRSFLENNRGRLIFIDEAYALSDPSSSAGTYKRDAVNEIINMLDNEAYRKVTSVVFAGYPGDMDMLYHINSGFRNRVSEISFPDYSAEDCMMILENMLSLSSTAIHPDARALCMEQLIQMRKMATFGNGRTVRKYSELLIQRRNGRLLGAPDPESAKKMSVDILIEDIPDFVIVCRKLNLSEESFRD